MGPVYTITKYKKEIEKSTYKFFWNRKKHNLLDTELNSPFGGTD